jgi:hypothetical protein
MSPLDDELRSLLHLRADQLDPVPDPLGGIESRARGLRRRRILTSVAGAAAVVVAVAVAVPLLLSGNGTATRQPGVTPTGAAFDPDHPWSLRGSAPLPELGNTLTTEDAQLFSQRAGGRDELFYVANAASNPRLGYLWKSTSGSKVTDERDRPMPADRRALQWTVPGDDGRGRLVVVAAPDAAVEYASNGNGYQPISDIGQAPKGIGLVPIEADDPNDTVRITEADGTTFTQDAPNWTPPAGGPPTNLVTWLHRGDAAQQPPSADVVHAFTQATGHSDDTKSHYLSLFDGLVSGVRYTVGQAYYDGDTKAHTFGYTTAGQVYLGPVTPMDTQLVALLVDSIPGSSTDLLVLVPRPGTGQLSYSPDATTKFAPVASGRSDLNGVGLVDRSKTAANDRIEQLDGDGNLDNPIYRGPVQPFLCGDKECG